MTGKKDASKSPRDTNGPVVKTGPNAGQNRSRNYDGAWRKKRSDAGEPRKKPGCFITTAVCEHRGQPDNCTELTVMRGPRDTVLASTLDGRRLISDYYAMAPKITAAMTPERKEMTWTTVEACVAAVRCADHERANVLYGAMVRSLRRTNEPVRGGCAQLPVSLTSRSRL